MTKKNQIQVFDDRKVRTVWDSETEEWYFSVVDYRRLGYSEQWINQRLRGIEIRKMLTDEWKRGGLKDQQYASLTDIITKQWSGMKAREYKDLKGLHKESLRDNITNVEFALNMLAEASTTEISKQENPSRMNEHVDVAMRGDNVARPQGLSLNRISEEASSQLPRHPTISKRETDHLPKNPLLVAITII